VFSQDVTRDRFCFIPDLSPYTDVFTDKVLRKKWKITEDEWVIIDSKISDNNQAIAD
jgi:site-specific DNA-methyltransferase (adenine-specific)